MPVHYDKLIKAWAKSIYHSAEKSNVTDMELRSLRFTGRETVDGVVWITEIAVDGETDEVFVERWKAGG